MKPKIQRARNARSRRKTNAGAPPRPTAGTAEGDDATIDADLAIQQDRAERGDLRVPLPMGMQRTHEERIENVPKEPDDDTFSPMAIGRPDTDPVPDIDNPAGVQGGRGPLNQEGQGNRQNDEAAELEQIEPDIDPHPSPR